MIGINRLVVWTLVVQVSRPNEISKPSYRNWLNADDVAYESDLRNEIQSKKADHDERFGMLFIPIISEECERMGICEDVPNYPEEHVRALVEEARWANPTRFDTRSRPFNRVPQMGSQSQNYQDLCATELKNITPRAARNLNNEWHFIVNTREGDSQTFTVEICKHPMSSCSNVVSFPSHYSGWCQQKYISRVMTAVNEYGKLIEAPYQLSSCCSCVYNQNRYY